MLTLPRLHRIFLTWIFLGAAGNLLAADSKGKQAIEIASGDTVSLLGTIAVGSAFGPPNFGETPEQDRKETYFVLSTSRPIRMKDSDGTQLPDTAKVQLILPSKSSEVQAKIKQHLGGVSVKVTGKAYPATTGHHHESVILVLETLDVTNARPEPPK